jgi:hypothetical protein
MFPVASPGTADTASDSEPQSSDGVVIPTPSTSSNDTDNLPTATMDTEVLVKVPAKIAAGLIAKGIAAPTDRPAENVLSHADSPGPKLTVKTRASSISELVGKGFSITPIVAIADRRKEELNKPTRKKFKCPEKDCGLSFTEAMDLLVHQQKRKCPV